MQGLLLPSMLPWRVATRSNVKRTAQQQQDTPVGRRRRHPEARGTPAAEQRSMSL
jgi:hypothetical protein